MSKFYLASIPSNYEMNRSVADKFLSFLIRVFRLLVRPVKPCVSTTPPPAEDLEELPATSSRTSSRGCRCNRSYGADAYASFGRGYPRFRQACSANRPHIFCLEYLHDRHGGLLVMHIVEDYKHRGFAMRKTVGMFPQLFRYMFKSSCNGMLDFDKSRVVESCQYWLGEHVTKRIVQNPIKKRIVKLLEAPRTSSTHRFGERYYERNVLVFDPCTNTYKLVRVFADEDGTNHPLATHVYDFGAQAWRSRERCPDDIAPDRCVFASGAWNWCCQPAARVIPGIASFDFRRETFNLISTPSNFMDKDSMFEIGGDLALINNHDIWVLQDYETKQWVKRCRLIAPVYDHISQLWPKSIRGSHHGQLVVYDNCSWPLRLWFYDMETEKLTWSSLQCRSPGCNHIFIATPSLCDP